MEHGLEACLKAARAAVTNCCPDTKPHTRYSMTLSARTKMQRNVSDCMLHALGVSMENSTTLNLFNRDGGQDAGNGSDHGHVSAM